MIIDEIRKSLGKIEGLDDLKLASAVFIAKEFLIKLKFVTQNKLSKDQENSVKDIVGKVINEKAPSVKTVSYSFEKDYLDCETAMITIKKYFDEHFKMLSSSIRDSLSCENAEGECKIKITINEELNALFEQMTVVEKLKNYFFMISNFPVKIKIDIIEARTDKEALKTFVQSRQDAQVSKAAFRPQRVNIVENVELCVGKLITEKPKYIIDIDHEEKHVVVCGRLQSPREIVTSTGYILYKYDIADKTGVLGAVMFVNTDAALRKKLNSLTENCEIIVSGPVAYNLYSNSLEMKVYDLCTCKICDEDYKSLQKRPVPKVYSVVKEESYKNPRQASFFTKDKVPEQIKDKSFVVFDFETTGIECIKEKIIELGAVKIENGIITKKFSTFVNPERDISKKISELTGIMDEDVRHAPVFEEVIADFYKFCDGCQLIAHNIEFDYGFLRFNTKNSGYIFTHPQIDTLSLAREHYAKPQFKEKRPPDYKLGTLVNHMGIEQGAAHRAIDDARMTAELFLRIMATSV